MRSARSLFNSAVFWKTVKRFWPIWALYAFVWVLRMPGRMISASAQALHDASWYAVTAASETAMWLCPAAALAAALAVFSHLYSERSANFYAALPVGRRAMFISCAAAGIVPLLAANLAVLALSYVTKFAVGIPESGPWSGLWIWFAAVSLELLAYYGLAVLCAMLTGHKVVMPLLFAAVNIAAVCLASVAESVPATFSYGYAGGGWDWATDLSPLIALVSNVWWESSYGAADGMTYSLVGWNYILAYGILGALLLPLAYVCYRRRAMESAGDVVAIAPLRPVFKYFAGLACGFLLGALFYEVFFSPDRSDAGVGEALQYSLCMAAGAFIGVFAAEMLLKKRFAVFRGKGSYIGWLAVTALCAAFVFGCVYDVTGYEKRIPGADEVETVVISGGGERAELGDDESIGLVRGLHALAIENEDENRAARSRGTFVYCTISYHMHDGGRLERRYWISEGLTDGLELLDEVLNSPLAIMQRMNARNGVTPGMVADCTVYYRLPDDRQTLAKKLSAEECAALYNECIYPELREGELGRVGFSESDAYLAENYDCTIGIEYSSGEYFAVTPGVGAEKTAERLSELGVELHTLEETGYAFPAVN